MQFPNTTLGKAAAPIVGLSVILLSSSSAQALSVSASDPFITVQASSGAFSGSISVPLASVVTLSDPDMDLWYWASSGPTPIYDGPNLVATLVNMTVLAGRNTQPDGEQRFGIDIDFGVQAGPGTTNFVLTSPTLSFSPLTNARGLVSAGLVGTDQNTNGIMISPSGSNGYGFNALYNGANVFRSYFNQSMSNLPSGSVGDSGNMVPAGVFQPMGTVSNMTSMYSFMVSAGDTAGGTTTYSVAPAPGTLAIIGLSGLLIGRRRR
jgi:hypothetical protein